MHRSAYTRTQIAALPRSKNAPLSRTCNLCLLEDDRDDVVAIVDGKTAYGPWAHMCEMHARTSLDTLAGATRIV